VDGGSGHDTLAVSGEFVLDLVSTADSRITGIEAVDLAAGAQVLALSAADVLALSDTSNTLTVEGDVGDAVIAIGAWMDNGIDGGHHIYTAGIATLRIDVDVAAFIV
jgi:hypothetical protein